MATKISQQVVFHGTHFFTVDAKWRITFPKEYLYWFGGAALIGVHSRQRAIIFNQKDLKRINAIRNDLAWRDRLYANIWICEFAQYENHTRISIPHLLRTHLNIQQGSEVVYVGVGECIFLMNHTVWHELYGADIGK